MSLLSNSLLLGAPAGATTYQVSRSLRFSSGDSSYLSRTPASAGNRKTWTWSGWVKRSGLGANGYLFEAGASDTASSRFLIRFSSDNTLLVTRGQNADRITSQVFRDVSAWGHLVVAVDTTQATANDRIKIYFNGTQITTFSSTSNPGQNDDLGVNAAAVHAIGRSNVDSGDYFNGYLADIWFLDGIAATPSDFAETDATTGQWIPKTYSGSKGSNGFHLEFADNSAATAATLGKDTSGNGLNWTPNNFSVGNTKTIQVGTPSYPSAFTTTGNKTSDQTALSYVYWGGTYTGAATKIFRASDVSVFSTTIDVSGPTLDRYLWYSDDAINWTYIGNLASLSRPYTLSGYKYYATSEGSGSATITVGALPAGNDSLVDTPSSYGTDDGLGGSVRGNYTTLNPLQSSATLSNGNLDCSTTSTSWQASVGTIFQSTGKWYAEFTIASNSGGGIHIGIVGPNYSVATGNYIGNTATSYAYRADGSKFSNATNINYGASYTTNDVIGVAMDLDAGTLVFYKNGTSQGTAYTGMTGEKAFAVSVGSTTGTHAVSCNFGQRAWAYTPPANHRPLVDTLLPTPVIAKSLTAFDVKLWTGNGSTQTISGLGFSPDFVWVKQRSSPARSPWLTDTVRGVDKLLASDQTTAEVVDTNCITAFNSDGFNLADDAGFNASSCTYVGWCWDAGSSTVTNTQGSITSSVRANASAGFSIVTYTGNATAGATIGHGLGVAPGMIIIKNRDDGGSYWVTYHSSLGGTKALALNLTDSVLTNSLPFNNTNPTSTVFSVGGGGAFSYSNNQSGKNHVAYCFAAVSGYSSFGSYTGNGSADGPFVYTGFRPRWVMVKASSSVSFGSWRIYDSARGAYNVIQQELYANLSNSEDASNTIIDFLSNGFKLRSGAIDGWNGNGATIIYAAFAENPFQYARAR